MSEEDAPMPVNEELELYTLSDYARWEGDWELIQVKYPKRQGWRKGCEDRAHLA